MRQELIHEQLASILAQRVAGGSFRHPTPPGVGPFHVSLATGSGYQFYRKQYRETFGKNEPDWAAAVHPSHLTALFTLALSTGKALPGTIADIPSMGD